VILNVTFRYYHPNKIGWDIGAHDLACICRSETRGPGQDATSANQSLSTDTLHRYIESRKGYLSTPKGASQSREAQYDTEVLSYIGYDQMQKQVRTIMCGCGECQLRKNYLDSCPLGNSKDAIQLWCSDFSVAEVSSDTLQEVEAALNEAEEELNSEATLPEVRL